jgi:hypothetical protein
VAFIIGYLFACTGVGCYFLDGQERTAIALPHALALATVLLLVTLAFKTPTNSLCTILLTRTVFVVLGWPGTA